jgi:hypothetical protein
MTRVLYANCCMKSRLEKRNKSRSSCSTRSSDAVTTLTCENVMKQATSLKDVPGGLSLHATSDCHQHFANRPPRPIAASNDEVKRRTPGGVWADTGGCGSGLSRHTLSPIGGLWTADFLDARRSHHHWTTSRVNMPQLAASMHFLWREAPRFVERAGTP